MGRLGSIVSGPSRSLRTVMVAVGLLAAIAVVDVGISARAVLIPLLVVGPLVAAVRASAAEVLGVSILATLIALGLGVDHGVLDDGDGITAVVAVVAGAALAVGAAEVRAGLEADAARHTVELDAERRARQRADILARSGELLGAQLDPGALLEQITGLLVPDHADLAIVDLVQEDGSLRGAVTRAADHTLAQRLRELRTRFPLDATGDHPVAVALRTGEAQRLDELSEGELREYARNDEHFALMREARYSSAMVLPLSARGRTSGVLSLLRLAGSAGFDAEDLLAGLDIARRAALALDNARLYHELRSTEDRLEAILSSVAEAVSAFAPDGTFVFTNQAAAELAGMKTPAELIERGLEHLRGRWVVLDETGREIPRHDLPLARALRGEVPAPTLLRVIERDRGRDLWLQSRVVPVRDAAGAPVLIVLVGEDVTLVKRQEMRERLLSTASKMLGSSLEVDATIDKTAWAVVPELADWARVDLPDERGVLRQVAVAHRDLEKLELLHEWRRDFPPDPADRHGPAEVLRTGRPVIWPQVAVDDVERYAQAPRHAELMRLIDTRSMVIVPMAVGDRVIGTIQLATTSESGRMLGPAELELAEELARRAAIAVENARVHAARTHIATTLQRSLLPPRLPVIPGLNIAARFRAAGAASDVGGDFYDLFEDRRGWMVLIGDVTGKGPAAAAITSLARYTMRTAAQYEDDPRAMLERLNATLVADAERRQICTAVCVSVRTPDGTVSGDRAPIRLEVTCAGHPAPLLVRADGRVAPVGRPGTLLGAFPDGRWTPDEVALSPGDALVLYTDGVTDTRNAEGRFGTERLEAALRGAGASTPDAIAQRIEDALVAFGEQRDDVALLVLGASAAGPRAVQVKRGSRAAW